MSVHTTDIAVKMVSQITDLVTLLIGHPPAARLPARVAPAARALRVATPPPGPAWCPRRLLSAFGPCRRRSETPHWCGPADPKAGHRPAPCFPGSTRTAAVRPS